MTDRITYRLGDIIEAVDAIHSLLDGKTFEEMVGDRVTKAAFERFLEILSEASRHIPEALRTKVPTVPWRRVGDIGNHLRHAYHRVDAGILWDIYEGGDLAVLREAAVELRATLTKGDKQ